MIGLIGLVWSMLGVLDCLELKRIRLDRIMIFDCGFGDRFSHKWNVLTNILINCLEPLCSSKVTLP